MITGPTCNFLMMLLSRGGEAPASKPVVEILRRLSAKKDSPDLDGAAVVENVLAGVARANLEYGTDYAPKTISYVPDDSAVYPVYRRLAYDIVKQAHIDDGNGVDV